MKNARKILALVLSLVMLLALGVTSCADYDFAANAKLFSTDYTGKTIILHSNDVHGRLWGYAYMTAMKSFMEAAGAEKVLGLCLYDRHEELHGSGRRRKGSHGRRR